MDLVQRSFIQSLGIFCFFIWVQKNLFVYGYNIETKKVGIWQGAADSQFGYSVAFANEPGWTSKYERSYRFDKVLLVGAPNTSASVSIGSPVIQGYGDVLVCTHPQTNTTDCSSLNIREVAGDGRFAGKSLCDVLRRDTNKSFCEIDQRMGATIAVNRQFSKIMYNTATVPMVTVCAPGWKNTYNEFSGTYQKYMIGVCLKLREDLQYMDCQFENSKEYCWPFWPQGTTAFADGRPVYSYAQSGFAADFSKDGYQEIIAAPGVEDWRGGFKSHQGAYEMVVERSDHPTTQFYGYALVSGNFKVRNSKEERCNILAGVPNFYDKDNGNLGKVEILRNGEKVEVVVFGKKRQCVETRLADMTAITDSQVGSKFGAAVAAIDITGDKYDEIFVGAPLYSGEQTEEGRVFVYTTTDYELCGPVGILSGSALIKSLKTSANYARFGTSITSAGDLNNDGYKDVAIGAPYEDDGRGAIYIYQGIGRCGDCLMENKYSQRILGKELDSNLRAFGWSIYGEDDIDHNGYPDLAVGAYASNQAVVLRTRPIASVQVKIEIYPNPIPLNGSSLACSRDKIRLCVEVKIWFTVIGKGLGQNLTLQVDLNADTVYSDKEGGNRLEFRRNGGNQLRDRFTAVGRTRERYEKEVTYILDVKNRSNAVEPKDIWTVVRTEGMFQLVNSSGSDFTVLDPVLEQGQDNRFQSDVAFEINCAKLEDCTSDLRLTVKLYLLSSGRIEEVSRDTIIYVDASNELQMKVDVTNLVSSSYGSKFTSSAGAALIREVGLSDSRQGAIDATCKQSSGFASSILNCSADSKLDVNQNFKVKAGFDISRARLMAEDKIENLQPYIEVDVYLSASNNANRFFSSKVNVTAGQGNNDVDTSNNDFTIKLPVMLKYNIEISVDKETSDQIRYSADEESSKIFTITHRYYVTNEGPSMLPKTYVNITIPLAMKEIVYADLKSVSEGCVVEGSEALVDTTLAPTSTEPTLTRFTLQTPKPQRRRRALEQQEPSVNLTDQSDNSNSGEQNANILNITCDEASQCRRISCLVKNLEKHHQKIINITLDIHEKSLAKTKNKREIRYGTSAVVTDPHVWFGGKVVPWDKTPFGEKYTTFIVEPATVVTEIDIWIIIGSVIGALVLLIIVVAVLWKVGFFKRKKHSKVKKWKQDSLYKRRSRASSTKSQTPYNPMEK